MLYPIKIKGYKTETIGTKITQNKSNERMIDAIMFKLSPTKNSIKTVQTTVTNVTIGDWLNL
jgi:hypothetical protein